MPNVAEALAEANLGAMAAMRMCWDETVNHCRRALELAPGSADTYNNLGVALINLGNAADAAACLQQAIMLDPSNADAHNNLGVALKSQGKTAEAVTHFRNAALLRPDHSRAHYNLGNALHQLGELSAAAAAYQRSRQLEPEFADCANNLGIVLTTQGKFDEAALCLRHALTLDPQHAGAHNNLGNLLRAEGRLEDAVRSYQQALHLQPDYPDAYNNLGVALQSLCKLDDAAECLQRALALDPRHADAYNNLGNVQKDQGKLDEAADHYDHALRCRPGFAKAHSNLLVCWNYEPAIDLDVLFAEHCRWAKRHALVTSATNHPNDRNPERRLRVGYMSPDFRRHPVADFLEPIFAHHDMQRVEVFAYAEIAMPDAVTTRFQARASVWRSTFGRSDIEICEQVRADRIDILVDLAGHTADSRLRVFAYQPAPVQITYLGYPNTTGLAAIDCRLTDALADPPSEPPRYTEELVRLPRAFCYAPPGNAPAVSPLPALHAGHVTFGSLHNLAKLNAKLLDLWCGILRRLPTTRILLLRDALEGETRAYFRRQFTSRGIEPDRLELLQTLDGNATHLQAYQAVDLSLDAFPWNGHTTACESLWMGVPVIALYGNRYAGRMAADTLSAVGLNELIAASLEQYADIAVDWAGDLPRLARLRSGLRERMRASPLCDGQAFTRNLEDAYRALWRRWCAKGTA